MGGKVVMVTSAAQWAEVKAKGAVLVDFTASWCVALHALRAAAQPARGAGSCSS